MGDAKLTVDIGLLGERGEMGELGTTSLVCSLVDLLGGLEEQAVATGEASDMSMGFAKLTLAIGLWGVRGEVGELGELGELEE